jgi:hypothetical protein
MIVCKLGNLSLLIHLHLLRACAKYICHDAEHANWKQSPLLFISHSSINIVAALSFFS